MNVWLKNDTPLGVVKNSVIHDAIYAHEITQYMIEALTKNSEKMWKIHRFLKLYDYSTAKDNEDINFYKDIFNIIFKGYGPQVVVREVQILDRAIYVLLNNQLRLVLKSPKYLKYSGNEAPSELFYIIDNIFIGICDRSVYYDKNLIPEEYAYLRNDHSASKGIPIENRWMYDDSVKVVINKKGNSQLIYWINNGLNVCKENTKNGMDLGWNLNDYYAYSSCKSKSWNNNVIREPEISDLDKDIEFIWDLNIKTSLKNVLLRARIMTTLDFSLINPEYIKSLKGIGKVAIQELIPMFEKYSNNK